MPLPTIEELTDALKVYVDAGGDQDAYIADCANQSVAFIEQKVPTVEGVSPIGDDLYKREVLELGAELFYRRQAKNGIVTVNVVDGRPVRISADPYKAAAARLASLRPLGFA